MPNNKFYKIFFAVMLFIFCLGFCCLNCVPDNDLWARLIAGEYIVNNFNVAKFDFVSYTPTHPWYDHEWGASVFFYLALKYFGHSGLIFLKGILIGLSLFICYKTVELRSPKSTSAYNILYFVCMFLALQKSIGSTVRCLLFTCLFFCLFLYILERARTGKTKSLYFLPLVMIFWSNIHGGCLSGIGLIGLYIVGEYLNGNSVKNYIKVFFCCLGALFINPYGWEYVKFLFFAGTMNRGYITEWQNSFCKEYLTSYMNYKIYLFVMLFTVIVYVIKEKLTYSKIDKTKFLILAVMTYLSVTHIRHQSFFVLAVGTLFYDEFYSLFNSFMSFLKNKFGIKDEDMIKSVITFKEIAVYFIIFIMAFPPIIAKNKKIKITDTAYPRFAVEFVKINKLEGNLFINFDWGSYAAYKLYPSNLIVMDGRYEEVYSPDLLMQLKDFHMLKNDWYKIIRDYKTDVMILETKYPVYNAILNNPDWAYVFGNNLFGVFVPATTKKDSYYLPVPFDDYYNINLFKK